ncbi:hypothetical protein Fmac_025901 [Flemingia macrophylla]|uniref:Uncharacterized protein n=1 Tax=Flemingia macrophylla TaxID=520843 RepID=A0ABD1LDC8_9FABA
MTSHPPSPASSGGFSPPSHGIIMVSPRDSQDAVFHTPPEDFSDASVDHCSVNHAVDVAAGSQGFVHLGRDSEFHHKQEIRVSSDITFDQFGDFEGELSDSEDGVGSDSSGECLQKEEGTGNCEGKKLVSESDESVNKVACTLEEGSGRREKGEKDLGDAVSVVECGSSMVKRKFSVFDVLRVISDIGAEDEDAVGNRSLWEVAQACGYTFPRPRWWPDNF